MKCDVSKEELLGYFYQDLPADEMKKFQTHLKKCMVCKKELAGFRQTSKIMRAWPDEASNLNLQFIHERASFWSFLKPDLAGFGLRRVLVGFSTALVLILFALSLFNFEASYSNGDFNLKLSLLPRQDGPREQPVDPLDVPVTMREFDTWKAESYQMIQALIRETESRSRRDYRLTLSEFARDIDLQRQQDLHWVGKSFEVVHLANEDKIRQTNRVLEHLIQAANYQIARPDSGQ